MSAQFSEAVTLLKGDVETMLDHIQDEAIRAGLTEPQQELVMQSAYRRMDDLQARWIGKLKDMCGYDCD